MIALEIGDGEVESQRKIKGNKNVDSQVESQRIVEDNNNVDSQEESQQIAEDNNLDNTQEDSHHIAEGKNFPPLPSFCCIGPCYYHNIEAEIPTEYQRTCRVMFLILKCYVFCLIINCIARLSALCIGDTDGGAMFGKAIFYLMFLPPIGFVTWYRQTYLAFKNKKHKTYMVSLILFLLEIILNLLWAIGGILSGAVGWRDGIRAIELNLTGKTVVAVIYFFCAVSWTQLTAAQIIVFIKIIAAYDASVLKEREERGNRESRGWHQVQTAATE